jgi:MFS family permease
MVSATSVALLGAHIPQSRLGRAVGWQAGITYVGLALGPVTAGYVLQRFEWRALFLINVPAVALSIAAVLSFAPPDSRAISAAAIAVGQPWYLPYVASCASMGMLVALMIAFAGPSEHVLSLGLAAVCCALFLWVQRRNPKPFWRSDLFRSRDFSTAAVAETIHYLCLYAIGLLIPVYLIQGRRFATAQVGILMAAQSTARAVSAPISGRMCDRVGPAVLTSAGMILLTGAVSYMYNFGADTPVVVIAATLALLGTGAGLLTPANSKALLAAAPTCHYGLSTGVLATARNVGMTLGASVAAILYSNLAGGNDAFASLQAVRPVLALTAAFAAISSLYLVVRIWIPDPPEWRLNSILQIMHEGSKRNAPRSGRFHR